MRKKKTRKDISRRGVWIIYRIAVDGLSSSLPHHQFAQSSKQPPTIVMHIVLHITPVLQVCKL